MPTTEQPDITLASTTETQAELDHATGPNWRQHFDPAKAKAEEDAAGKAKPADSPEKKVETKIAPASEPGKPASKEEEDAPLPKGVQKKLDRMTAKLRETERELQALKGRGEPAKAEPAKAASAADPEPQVKDFKSWDEWNAAHNRWLVRDEQRKLDAQTSEREAQESAKATYDAHLERVEQGREAHEDFDEAISGMGTFEFSSEMANRAFQMAVVDSENGAELMYHLAHHPDDMAKFADLSPTGVQRMVGRLEARLFPDGAAPSSSVARAKPVTRTPKPTAPVRGTTTAPTALDDPTLVKDTDAWIARRQAQLASRRH